LTTADGACIGIMRRSPLEISVRFLRSSAIAESPSVELCDSFRHDTIRFDIHSRREGSIGEIGTIRFASIYIAAG
jgi:hypothetical protein